MKCPYCRMIFDKVLPYIPNEYNEKKTGINYPLKHCMTLPIDCEWVNIKGKYKNTKCERLALYIGEHCYCKIHYLKAMDHKTLDHKTPIVCNP